MKAVYCQFCDTPLLNINLTKIIMEARKMDILNIESTKINFGVRIHVNNKRSIFLMKGNSVETFDTELEVNKKVEEVNKILKQKPELVKRFRENKSIKAFTMDK